MKAIMAAIGYLLVLSVLLSPSLFTYELITENAYMGKWLTNLNGGGFNWYALVDWLLFSLIFAANAFLVLVVFLAGRAQCTE